MALGWRGQYIRYRSFFLNIFDVYKRRADLKAFLEVILSLSTIAIFIVFALKPTILTIISLSQQISEKRATLTGLEQKVNNLKTAADIIAESQSVIPDIDRAVSTAGRPDIISKQVQGLAAKDSVTLLGLSIGEITLVGKDTSPKKTAEEVKEIDNAEEMPVSISIKGDYLAISAFIKDIENLRVIMKIDTLGINSSSTEIGQIIVAVISGRIPFTGQAR